MAKETEDYLAEQKIKIFWELEQAGILHEKIRNLTLIT